MAVDGTASGNAATRPEPSSIEGGRHPRNFPTSPMTSIPTGKPRTDLRARARARRFTQTALAGCAAAAAVCLVLVALWLSVALTWEFPVFSQTAAAWLQAIGVPVAIYVTVWSVRHHATAEERAAVREARDERVAAVQAREVRRLEFLFEAHALLHGTTRLISAGLEEVGRFRSSAHVFVPAWELWANRRRDFAELSLNDAPPEIKSWWGFADDKFCLIDLEFTKLAATRERSSAALSVTDAMVLLVATGMGASSFVGRLKLKAVDAGETVGILARQIESEIEKLKDVRRGPGADAYFEPFARWDFMEPFYAFDRRNSQDTNNA